MPTSERERIHEIFSINGTGNRLAFWQGKEGETTNIPRTLKEIEAFALGLDFRFKRMGIGEDISAEEVFAPGKSFASGFLLRFGTDPEYTARSEDFYYAFLEQSTRYEVLNDPVSIKDRHSYLKGTLLAIKILRKMKVRQLSKIGLDDATYKVLSKEINFLDCDTEDLTLLIEETAEDKVDKGKRQY